MITKIPTLGRPRQVAVGFTMIEILVVVLILAIAAGIVIPNVINTADLQAISAARMIASDLQYAQNTAITSQSSVKVVFDTSGNFYKLTKNDSQSTPLKHPINKTDYIVNFANQAGFNQLTIVSAVFGSGQTVKFDPIGAPDNPGVVTVKAGSETYRISVAAATGLVTVTEGP